MHDGSAQNGTITGQEHMRPHRLGFGKKITVGALGDTIDRPVFMEVFEISWCYDSPVAVLKSKRLAQGLDCPFALRENVISRPSAVGA